MAPTVGLVLIRNRARDTGRGAAPSAPARGRALPALVGLFLGAFAVGTDGFMIAGLLGPIAADFHASMAVTAQLVTVFSIGYAVGAPVLASILYRFGRRTLLLAGLVGLALANAAAALAGMLWVLFAARAAAALAAAVYGPTAAVVATRLAPAPRRGRALSVITAGLTLSIVSGVPIGNMIGREWGWRVTFGVVAVLSAVLALALSVMLRPIPPDSARLTLGQRLSVLAGPGPRGVLAVTLLGILAGYLGYTYVGPISDAMGASSDTALSLVLLCFGIGAATGSWLSGAGVDRYGQVLVVRTGALVQALALAILATGDAVGPHLGVAPAAAGFALLGMGSWTYNAPQQHRLVELAPASATVLVSLNSSAIYTGIALSGALGALTLSLGTTLEPPLDHSVGPTLTCATATVIALVTALAAGRRPRPTRRTSTTKETP